MALLNINELQLEKGRVDCMSMDITPLDVKAIEIFNGYSDNDEEGVVAYGGKLNIRPKYQREFIYPEKDQKEVIKTMLKGFPLNIMYWAVSDDGSYELLDGQQRTLSFCKYMNNEYSVDVNGNPLYYHSLREKQSNIDDYILHIYICEGSDTDKLEWFNIINKAGKELKPQELLNATYTGEWLTQSKRYFSKTGCPASSLFGDYLSGEMNRQAYLEAALKWIGDRDNITAREYMARHQKDTNCNDLWMYFSTVANWAKMLFPKSNKNKKIIEGLPWGIYYNKYHKNEYDSEVLKKRFEELIMDKEVENNKGIIEYLLCGDENCLGLRAFDEDDKLRKYNEQGGKCPLCSGINADKIWEYDEMEGDHIIPWHSGGKTTYDNLQMLCRHCNRTKSGK